MFDGGLLIFTKKGLVYNYTGVMEEYKRLSALPYRESLAPMTAFQGKVERGEGLYPPHADRGAELHAGAVGLRG